MDGYERGDIVECIFCQSENVAYRGANIPFDAGSDDDDQIEYYKCLDCGESFGIEW